jgi:hypothetical protein
MQFNNILSAYHEEVKSKIIEDKKLQVPDISSAQEGHPVPTI